MTREIPPYEDLVPGKLGGRLARLKHTAKVIPGQTWEHPTVYRRVVRDRFLSGDRVRVVDDLTPEQAVGRLSRLLAEVDIESEVIQWSVAEQPEDGEQPRMFGATIRKLYLPSSGHDKFEFQVHDKEIMEDTLSSGLIYTLILNQEGAWYLRPGADDAEEIPADRFCIEVEDAMKKGEKL